MPKKNGKKELQPVDEVTKAIMAANQQFDLKKNMEGIRPRLPQIGILHQGQLFIMPDEDKRESFTGLILDHHNINAFWSTPFSESGGGDPPDCYSMDGIKPDTNRIENPVHDNCFHCPNNKFGTEMKKDGTPGRGKLCKNMKRLHIMMPDEIMPFRLTVPPSSIEAVDLFISRVRGKELPHQLVPTTFSLKEVSNKDSIKYSELVMTAEIMELQDGKKTFKFIMEPDAQQTIKNFHAEWLPIMREQSIEAEEYAGTN